MPRSGNAVGGTAAGMYPKSSGLAVMMMFLWMIVDVALLPSQRGLECWYGDRDLLLLRWERRLSSRFGLFVLS